MQPSYGGIISGRRESGAGYSHRRHARGTARMPRSGDIARVGLDAVSGLGHGQGIRRLVSRSSQRRRRQGDQQVSTLLLLDIAT